MTIQEAYKDLSTEQKALLAIIDKSSNVIFTNRQRRTLAIKLDQFIQNRNSYESDTSTGKDIVLKPS